MCIVDEYGIRENERERAVKGRMTFDITANDQKSRDKFESWQRDQQTRVTCYMHRQYLLTLAHILIRRYFYYCF